MLVLVLADFLSENVQFAGVLDLALDLVLVELLTEAAELAGV
jgi:hypothetical protein